MQWFLKVVKNYATFSGRARRKEYWMFMLFNILIQIALYIPTAIFISIQETVIIGGIFALLYTIYAFAMLIPSLAVIVRRLHDQDKSGWWYFVALIPFIGGIWFLVLMCLEGTSGDNQYGPASK